MGRPKNKNWDLGLAVLDTLGPGPWPGDVTAAVVGVTQQAVSKEHKRIMQKLRKHGEAIAARQGVRITGRKKLLEILGTS